MTVCITEDGTMPENDDKDWFKQTLRATFPYIVFIAVFILGTLVVILWASSEEPAPGTAVLRQAHSHNDYHREHPLDAALDLGFCSVEADIHLVEGALLVAHDREDVDPARTLAALYLDPLWKRFQERGRIYPGGVALTLLVDIKSDGAATYEALHGELQRYAPMLTRYRDGSVETGAVSVIISGNRAMETILNTAPRLAGIDGRLADLDGSYTASEMPLISDNWMRHFKWWGTGEFPEAQRARLHEIVRQAHEKGMRVRFWATPEREPLWQALVDANVDLLNADDLPRLSAFLNTAGARP